MLYNDSEMDVIMKKLKKYIIFATLCVFGGYAENNNLTIKDITKEDVINYDGQKIHVRVFDYDLINKKVFNNDTKAKDLSYASVIANLKNIFNNRKTICFKEKFPSVDVQDVSEENIKKFTNNILESADELYKKHKENNGVFCKRFLQKMDLFSKIIDVFDQNKKQFQFVFNHTYFGGPSACYGKLINYYSIGIALFDQAYCQELRIKNVNTDIYKIDI